MYKYGTKFWYDGKDEACDQPAQMVMFQVDLTDEFRASVEDPRHYFDVRFHATPEHHKGFVQTIVSDHLTLPDGPKAFLIECGEYDDYRIVAVALDREKAEGFVEANLDEDGEARGPYADAYQINVMEVL